LIDNPLKTALVEEMCSTLGISEDVADAVVHNAYIKGYEAAQTNVIKEAFDFLYHQDIDKFSDILKFVRAYDGSQDTSKFAQNRENFMKKDASERGVGTPRTDVKTASAPLRSTPTESSKDETRKVYADFWRAYQMETFKK